jgi:hypothetical protein
MWVGPLKEIDLPLPGLFLERLLALNGNANVVKFPEPHQSLHAVPLREARHNALAMLEGAPDQIARDTDMERA